jgi:small-conductance mechanosensitive channel
MSSKEKEHAQKKFLSQRGKRVDYKLLNEGVGDEEEESFWPQGHITDLKLLSGDVDLAEVTTKPEDEGNSDSHDAKGAIGPDILEMRKELQALQQEEKQLKDQMSEAEMLRKQIAQKKEDVQKLRGEAIQSSNSRTKSNFAKKSSVQNVANFDQITIDDLRKNKKIRRKAKSQLNKIGLDIFNSTSESDSDSDSNVSSLNKSQKVRKSSKKK